MDATSWEDKLRERYCDKAYYFLHYEGESEEADCYEWEYVATEEYICGYFIMRIYYNPKTRLVTDFECERYDEESDARPTMEDGNVTRIQQREFTAFLKSCITKDPVKAGSIPDDECNSEVEDTLPTQPHFTGVDADYENLVTAIIEGNDTRIDAYIFAASYPYKKEYENRIDTPLHEAIKLNRRDICQKLIDNGADANGLFRTQSAVLYAIHHNRFEIAEWLLQSGICQGKTILETLLYDNNYTENWDLLIGYFERGICKWDSRNNNCNIAWLQRLPDQYLNRFLQLGVNISESLVEHILKSNNDDLLTTLNEVARNDISVARVLVEYYIKHKNYVGFEFAVSLHSAHTYPSIMFENAYKRGRKWTDCLIRNGYDINCEEGVPLYRACINADLPKIKYLIKNGADPNLHASYRPSDLELAVDSYTFLYCNETERIKREKACIYLLEHGADLFDVGTRKPTPMECLLEGSPETIQYIEEYVKLHPMNNSTVKTE